MYVDARALNADEVQSVRGYIPSEEEIAMLKVDYCMYVCMHDLFAYMVLIIYTQTQLLTINCIHAYIQAWQGDIRTLGDPDAYLNSS